MRMGTGQHGAFAWHPNGLLNPFPHLLGERQAYTQQIQADQDYLGVAEAQQQKLGKKRVVYAQALSLAGCIPVKTASYRRGDVDLNRTGQKLL